MIKTIKYISKIVLFGALLTLFSGCGSLTKMRYSRGFKSEIDLFSVRKHPQDKELKANKAIKKDVKKSIGLLTINDPGYDSALFRQAVQTKSVVEPRKHFSSFVSCKTTVEPGRRYLLNKITPQKKKHSSGETAEMYDTQGLTIIAVGLMLAGITLFVLGAAQIIAVLWITVGAIAFFSGVVLVIILTIINLVNGGWKRQVEYEKSAIKNRIIWGLILGVLLIIVGLFS